MVREATPEPHLDRTAKMAFIAPPDLMAGGASRKSGADDRLKKP
jgi:hypothetical protein